MIVRAAASPAEKIGIGFSKLQLVYGTNIKYISNYLQLYD